MDSNYDDIITNLTVSPSSPWSEKNETVGGNRNVDACLIDENVTDPP